MPVTNEQLEQLVDFEGEIRIPSGYDSEGNANAWEIHQEPQRGAAWDEVLAELGPQGLGQWAGTLALAHTGSRDAAHQIVEGLANQEPPLPDDQYIQFLSGMESVQGMRYQPAGGRQ